MRIRIHRGRIIRYSATQNNGRITKENDLISGEEVQYTYDSLNRLSTAVTTDSLSVALR